MLELDIYQRLGDLELQIQTCLPSQGVTAIFGVSGSGKTSLINLIAGLTRPQSGRITLNDTVLVDCGRRHYLPPEKRRVGYVFQDARLFPHYRVKGNLDYGVRCHNPTRFQDIVSLLGIGHLLDRYPSTLSGGEKQRVAIGRALLMAPDLLLMDEPLASLDVLRKREVLPYLEQLSREVNIPILYVSHSMQEILSLADNVLVLDQGKVLAYGALEQVWSSSALRPWLSQDEQSSVLKVHLQAYHPDYAMSALALGDQTLWVNPLEGKIGQTFRIAIKSTDVSLVLHPPQGSSIRNILPARVEEILQNCHSVEVKLNVAGQTLWSRITVWAKDELNLNVGDSLYAQVKSVSISRGSQR